jgi:hypothetical protein
MTNTHVIISKTTHVTKNMTRGQKPQEVQGNTTSSEEV